MEKTYWNGNGRYQKIADVIEDQMPDYGYTENNNMNIYISALHFYYDCCNNGGCNYDIYAKDYEEKLPVELRREFSFVRKEGVNNKKLSKLCCDEHYAEMFMDRVLEYLSDKDCSYRKYEAYFTRGLLSYNKKEGWDKITFGSEERREEWILSRIKNLGNKLVQ